MYRYHGVRDGEIAPAGEERKKKKKKKLRMARSIG